MKEIIAVVRMNKTNATKKALIEAGAAGFTALKVMGRGKRPEGNGPRARIQGKARGNVRDNGQG